MYIVFITYTAPLEKIDEALAAHRAHLGVYYEKGWLIASGPQTPRTGGILIANAPSREALDQMIAADPYVTQRLAEYKVVEFTPVKFAKAFEPFLEAPKA